MKNWKTSLAGILVMIITICSAGKDLIDGKQVDLGSLLRGIAASAGFVYAKDRNVTGGTTPQ